MNKPEWKKEVEALRSETVEAFQIAINSHDEDDKHRTIHISTTSPTNSDGSNGDVWLIYET